MIKAYSSIRYKILHAKWLPLALALTLVFMPNSLLIVKVLGGLIALVLFYYSIVSSNSISIKDLPK